MADQALERLWEEPGFFTPGTIRLLDLVPISYSHSEVSCDKIIILNSNSDEVEIKLDVDEVLGSSFSSACSLIKTRKLDGELVLHFTKQEVERLPHEVFLKLLRLPLSKMSMADIGVRKPGLDNLTPDYISVRNKKAVILELKTHKEYYWEGERDQWFAEQWKYWPSLKEKLTIEWSFVVGTLFLFKNKAFVPEFLSELDWEVIIKGVQSAWSLQNYLFSKTLLERDFAERKPVIQHYTNLLRAIDYPVKKEELHFDKNEIQRVTGVDKKTLINFHKIMRNECNFVIETDKQNVEEYYRRKKLMLAGKNFTSCHEVEYKNQVKEKLNTYGENPKKLKSVCQHPLVSILNTGWTMKETTYEVCQTNRSPEALLWDQYLMLKYGRETTCSLNLSELEENIECVHASRSKRFVEILRISRTAKLSLALKGVRGKKFRHHEEKRTIDSESQKGFPLWADTKDIEDFIEHTFEEESDWLRNTNSHEPLLETMMLDFESFERDFSVCKSNLGLDELVKQLMKTRLFRALRVLENFVSEVNYSRLTNLKDENSFIVKKVPSVDAYIMIVPTRADRHIFYSILTPKSSVEMLPVKPLKPLMSFGNYYISEFVSLDADRISHLLGCSNKLLSLFIQKLQTNFPIDCSSPNLTRDWSRECALSLLIFLEDKAQTSTALLNVRYAYMELLSLPENLSHPLKILKKMPTIIRSRLLIWCLNSIIAAFNKMYHLKICEGITVGETDENEPANLLSDEDSRDKLKNLISWVSMEPLDRVSHMLDLSYLGHLHNKEEGDILQGHFQIFSKVAREEIGLRDCNKEYLLGLKDPLIGTDVKSHEFSVSFVKVMAHVLKLKLTDTLMEKFPNLDKSVDPITWYLCDRLSQLDLRELVTTKASAWEMKANEKHDQKHDDTRHRRKVLSSVHHHFRQGSFKSTNVLEMAISSIKEIKGRENEGFLVNLFRKQQLGGTREIFVLTFDDRIAMYIVETISRALCELMENEMLTKGDAKIIRSDEHMKEVHQKTNGSSFHLTGTTSGDATTWCQRFTMKIFGVFLFNLLPETFHPYVANILNFVTNKRLQLPTLLLNAWKKYPSIVSFDPAMQEMKRQFLDFQCVERDLLDYDSRMLKNRSNFMQGIMHYTSSLMHSAYLFLLSQIIQNDFRKHGFDGVVTTKCSSDDSSLILSLISEDKERLSTVGKRFIRRSLQLVNNLYWTFGAKSSVEKTTLSVLNLIEEFNSVWLVKNTVVMPVIKFVISAFRIPPFSKLDSGQQQLAIARSQLVASGATFLLSKVVQKQQALYYYKTLGLFCNEEGSEIYLKLKKTLSPFLGYFIFEPPVVCGLLGYEFAYYLHLARRPEALLNHYTFFKSKTSKLDDSLEFQSQITIGPGGLKRYNKLCREINVNRQEIIKHYEDKPEELFQRWLTPETAMKGIEYKATKYETAETYSGLKDSTTHSRGVYFTTSKIFNEKNWFETKGSKNTWLYLMRKYTVEGKTIEDDPSGWRNLFPLADFYDEVLKIMIQELDRTPVRTKERRNLVVSRSLRAFEGPLICQLRTCAAFKWFSLTPKDLRSLDDITLSWDSYKKQISWLRDTIDETLLASPFDSRLELCSFIMAYSHKTKTMNTLSPMKLNISTEEFVRKLIRWNQWNQNSLKRSTKEDNLDGTPEQKYVTSSDLTTLRVINTIANIACLPPIYAIDKQTGLTDELPNLLLKKLSQIKSVQQICKRTQLQSRDVAECLKCLKFFHDINEKLRPRDRQQALRECLSETGSSYIHYNSRQKKLGNTWSGYVNIDVIIDGVKLNVEGRDQILEKINCVSVSSVATIARKLCSFLLEQGFRTCKPNSKQQLLFINLLTGKTQRERDSNTLPIVLSGNLDRRLQLPKDPNPQFVVRDHSIKLVEKNTDTTIAIGRIHRLGHFQAPDENLIEECFDSVTMAHSLAAILKDFCLNVKVNAGVAQSFLEALINPRNENQNICRDWLKKVLECRMKAKCLIPQSEEEVLCDLLSEESRTIHHETDNNYFDIIPDVNVTDDEILKYLKEMEEESDDSANETGLKAEVPLDEEEAEIDELELFQIRQKVIPREPSLYSEKSWFDCALQPLTQATQTEVELLIKGRLTRDLCSYDLFKLAEFMSWEVLAANRHAQFF